MLEGRAFTIYMNHKLLTTAINLASDPWTAQQCRQLAYVAEYTSDIRHIAGTSNVVADALSQPPVPLLLPRRLPVLKRPPGLRRLPDGKASQIPLHLQLWRVWWHTCLREGATWHPAAATQSIPVPQRRFTHLHVDLVGLLPNSVEGFKYLFTIIDWSLPDGWKPFQSRTWRRRR
jgi:hypothetical protein